MSVAWLPAPLGTLRVPHHFSPSSWGALQRCPLRVWGSAQSTTPLPESPEALFGTLLHDCRKRFLERWRRHDDAKVLMKSIFTEELLQLEGRLAANGLASLVPLKSAIDWHRWTDRTHRLVQWAAARVAEPLPWRGRDPVRAQGVTNSGDTDVETDDFSLGVERWWAAHALRLRGRPDEAVLGDDGAVEISDFKTGAVLDDDGRVDSRAVAQLQLYAIMAEHLRPGCKVRLSVAQSRRVAVPWTAAERGAMTDQLRELSDRFPSGAEVDASSVAVPGPHCAGCRVRHTCSRYLQELPSWWRNGEGHPRPLPYDVWGRVDMADVADGSWHVAVTDPIGRRVQVSGLSRERPLDALAPGAHLYMFGLEPAEDVAHHGMLIQPLNFYEHAPGPPWKSARCAMVFQSVELAGRMGE